MSEKTSYRKISWSLGKAEILAIWILYRFEFWKAHRQYCCRDACQIAERSYNSKYESRGFEASQDLAIIRHLGYCRRAQVRALCLKSSKQLLKPRHFLKTTNHVSKTRNKCAIKRHSIMLYDLSNAPIMFICGAQIWSSHCLKMP